MLCEGIKLNPLVKSVLGDYIRFLEYDSKDSNKSRWKTCKWWSDYLENLEKIELSSLSVETTITKKKDWICKATSKSQLMVYLSKLDNVSLDSHSSEFIKEVLTNSLKNITEKDIQLINDDRAKNKLPLFTKKQIEDYVRDIQDVIIYSSNNYLD